MKLDKDMKKFLKSITKEGAKIKLESFMLTISKEKYKDTFFCEKVGSIIINFKNGSQLYLSPEVNIKQLNFRKGQEGRGFFIKANRRDITITIK